MIEYLMGRVAELAPTYMVIETAGGVAYRLEITLNTYTALQQQGTQGAQRVLVHEVIREDAWTLYGFVREVEREMFRQLIGVSGVGAASARMILSAIDAQELGGVIATGNISRLKGVKGIGQKTAQRIIVDLKDKINAGDASLIVQPEGTTEAREEALAALVMLGFTRQQSQKALAKIFDAEPAIKVEAAIKQALAMM